MVRQTLGLRFRSTSSFFASFPAPTDPIIGSHHFRLRSGGLTE